MIISARAADAHARAVEAGADHYIDPDTGLLVMTSIYLRRRGYCCENSCRHCPYDDTARSAREIN